MYIPAIGILAGCVCKVVLNITLIRIPSINIYGAAFSSIICQLVAFLVNFLVLIRFIPLRITLVKYIIKPLAAGVIMGGVAFGLYTLIHSLLGGTGYTANLIASLIAIVIAGIVYITLIIVFKTMDKSDILLLPSGSKIYNALRRIGIYR